MSGGEARVHDATDARAELLLRASRHPLAADVAAALESSLESSLENSLEDAPPTKAGRMALLVSGGGDSMAMLLLVAAICERDDAALESLAVLSVDHGLRPDARAECESAVRLAATLGIARREIVRVEVQTDGNLLDRAREARLDAAVAFAARHACGCALLAHTADDRAESLLMGLAQGHGLASAARLVPRRALDDRNALTLVRPLLGITRARLRGFLAELGVTWHDDPSNALHQRGALRVDPALARLVERIAVGASRLADEAAEMLELRDAQRVAALAPGATSIDRPSFDALPAATRRALLHALAERAGGRLSRASMAKAMNHLAREAPHPARFRCGATSELVIDRRTVSVASLRQAIAAETVRGAGHDAALDPQHHG